MAVEQNQRIEGVGSDLENSGVGGEFFYGRSLVGTHSPIRRCFDPVSELWPMTFRVHGQQAVFGHKEDCSEETDGFTES